MGDQSKKSAIKDGMSSMMEHVSMAIDSVWDPIAKTIGLRTKFVQGDGSRDVGRERFDAQREADTRLSLFAISTTLAVIISIGINTSNNALQEKIASNNQKFENLHLMQQLAHDKLMRFVMTDGKYTLNAANASGSMIDCFNAGLNPGVTKSGKGNFVVSCAEIPPEKPSTPDGKYSGPGFDLPY